MRLKWSSSHILEARGLIGGVQVAMEVEAEEEEEGPSGSTFTDYVSSTSTPQPGLPLTQPATVSCLCVVIQRPSKMSLGPPHPDPVVETASLSAVEPPEPKYELSFTAEFINSGVLSCLQLETVLYASQVTILDLRTAGVSAPDRITLPSPSLAAETRAAPPGRAALRILPGGWGGGGEGPNRGWPDHRELAAGEAESCVRASHPPYPPSVTLIRGGREEGIAGGCRSDRI